MNAQNNFYQTLVEAIPLRRSARAYLTKPLSEEILTNISSYFDALPLPFAHHTRLQMFQAEPGKKLYNNGINPVNNIAFLSQTDLISVTKTGFVGQLIMLYIVSLSFDTCWFGHYKLSELGKYIPGIATPERIKESTFGYGYGKHVDVGERVICCLPFGRRNEKTKRLVDIVANKRLRTRKPLDELLETPEPLESIPVSIREALDLARLAPSAANSQMWRFGFYENYSVITVAKPVTYKHFKWEHPEADIGMCAAHLWLGLLAQGYAPKVEITQDNDRALWSFTLS